MAGTVIVPELTVNPFLAVNNPSEIILPLTSRFPFISVLSKVDLPVIKSLLPTVRSSFIVTAPAKLGVTSPRPVIALADIDALGKETIPASTVNPFFAVKLLVTVISSKTVRSLVTITFLFIVTLPATYKS